MKKLKLITTVTLIIGVLLFILEGSTYILFKKIYSQFFNFGYNKFDKIILSIKLFSINFLIAFLITIIFDTIYSSLPGGFLRKGINFSFILWTLEILPVSLHLYILSPAYKDLVLLLLFQYLIMSLIVGFVLTGIYDEYYLKKEEKQVIEIKKEQEKVKDKEEENVEDEKNSSNNINNNSD